MATKLKDLRICRRIPSPAAIHGALANILFALLIVHVLAAIYRQFWRRDNVFWRISLLREGPGTAQSVSPARGGAP